VALRALGVLAFDIPAGWALARLGERATIFGASVAVVLTLVGFLLTDSVVVFAALSFVQGCGWSAWQLARMAHVAEVVSPALRGRAMSLLGGAARVGLLVGPFLGAGLSHFTGLHGVFVLDMVLCAAGAAVLLASVPRGAGRSSATEGPPVRALLRTHSRALLTAGFAATSIQALRQARNSLLPLWADHLGYSAQTASILFGISLGVEVLCVYPGGSVMDRFGRKAVAVPCLIIMGAGLALIPATRAALELALVAMALGVGNGLSSGVVMTLGADLSPAAGRVAFLGIWRVFGDIGTAGGPLAVAVVTAILSLGGAAVTVGAGGLAAALYVVRHVPETGRPTGWRKS
jgi:MFS family permease